MLGGVAEVALVIVIAFTAHQMPARATVRRLALALLFLFGLNAALLTILAVAGLNWHPRLLIGCYLGVGVLLPGRQGHREGFHFASEADRWALAAGFGAFAVLYSPHVGASTGRSMAMLSYVTDNATHLYLVQDIRQYGGYINLRAPVDGWAGMIDYPPAWAGNIALMVQLLLGDDPAISSFVHVVIPLIIGCYALLVFFAAAIVLDVANEMSGRVGLTGGFLACGCLGLTTIVGVNVFLIQGGFYTQLMATTVILASVCLMIEDSIGRGRRLITLSLFTVALMQTWYLLAPVLGAVLLVFLAAARPTWRQLTLAAVPTLLLSAYPVMNGPQASSQINEPGPSPLPTIGGILGLLLVTVIGATFILTTRGTGREHRLPLAAASVASLLLVVAVLAFQGLTTARFNYYAFKLFYTVFLLGTVAGTAAAVVSINQMRAGGRTRRRTIMQALLAVLVVSGLGLGSYTTRTLSWSYALGQTPTRTDGHSLDALFAAYPNGLPKGIDAWMLDGCDRISDHIASKWAYDLSARWSRPLKTTYFDFALAEPTDVSALAQRAVHPSVKRMELYVRTDCEPDVRRALEQLPNVVVVTVR